ncbi:MAG: FkbM family methyltransferase [Planctomycetes bacterium]|nr:FkbM family methyltransferase [Planctomycetota bacterium]
MLPVPEDHRSVLRSASWFVRTHLLRRRKLTAIVDALGLEVRAFSRDLVGRHLYKRGVYEPDLTAFVLQRLSMPADAVALDIGANLGWYSMLLGRRFPGAQVHAFEPEARNLELLRENVRRNGCRGVTVHGVAVAEANQSKLLYTYPEKNMGRHSLLAINRATPVEVRAVRLDDFLAEQHIAPERVGFVKIDIEGYEELALRGAPRLLAAGPALLIEYAPKYMRRGGLDPAACLDLLRGAGYRAHLVTPAGQEPCPEAKLSGDERLDLLWLRP